jgi:hypothetical protein
MQPAYATVEENLKATLKPECDITALSLTVPDDEIPATQVDIRLSPARSCSSAKEASGNNAFSALYDI